MKTRACTLLMCKKFSIHFAVVYMQFLECNFILKFETLNSCKADLQLSCYLHSSAAMIEFILPFAHSGQKGTLRAFLRSKENI